MLVAGALKKNKLNIILILILFVSAGFLRFYQLGYSNYTADEYGAMIWTKDTPDKFPSDLKEFFLTRKKGPLQYLVSYVPIYLTGEYNNELAVRVPFALFSVLSVVVFYLLIERLTKKKLVAFIAATLLMTSGFISAFGRIAQYQNLNMFFSFLGLYFYSELLVSDKNLLRKTILGTISLSLSFLAHWDVIFILPPLLMILGQFLKDKKHPKVFKKKLLLVNLAVGALLVLPFLIPYLSRFQGVEANKEYLGRRIGLHEKSNIKDYLFDLEFYNPFLTTWVYIIGGAFGALLIKRNKMFLIWFLANFAFFEFFVRRPGTHIYNFLIPLFVLVAIGVGWLIEGLPKYLKVLPILLSAAIIGFLYYQTYLIFVDHSVEYPWRQEDILGYETVEHSHKHRPRYLIGFPHNRYWEEINDFINEQNALNNESFGYMTNESKTISEYYMDVGYKTSGGYYAIGIKYPWSFQNDYKFPQINKKTTIRKIQNEYGERVVRIYRVEPR